MESEAKGDIDVRVSDIDNGESIMIVITYFKLIVLDLQGNWDGSKRPIVLKEIDIENDNFPRETGVMKLADKGIFMFGGIVSDERHYWKSVKTMYKLNLGPNWSLERTNEVEEPITTKTLPRVIEVDEMVYVLQRMSDLCNGENPYNPFEVYDIASNTWKMLPMIPIQESWSQKEKDMIKRGNLSAAFVAGCRIYIQFGDPKKENIFVCFNTSKFEWEEKNAYNLKNSFRNHLVPFPDMGKSVSRIDGLDDGLNVILYDLNTSMIAYLIDDSGYLLCDQVIGGLLYSGLSSDNVGTSLVDLISGGGRMCLVITEIPAEVDFIHIRHFELKIKQGCKEEIQKLQAAAIANVPAGFGVRVRSGLRSAILVNMKFLEVGNITEQCYTFTDVRKDLFMGFRDAFFL